MISLFYLLQTPLVFYTIVLTIILIFIQIISRSGSKRFILDINNYALSAVLTIYAFLTVLLINMNYFHYFPYLHTAIFAFTFMAVSCSSRYGSRFLNTVVFIVALMPVVVMISTKHPLPLGDDARFIGFAKAIAEDGRWIPYKYEENLYYQFFHLIPFLQYVLALVSGFGLEDVTTYYLILKLCLYFVYLFAIYLIVKRLTLDEFSSFAAVLLLSITPPLALTQVVHQVYAIVLSLVTLYLLWRKFEDKQPVTSTLAMFPLLVAGIVSHATYTIMIIAFIIPFSIAGGRWVKNPVDNVAKFLTLLTSISLTYWIYTYVLDLIVKPTVDAATRLIELLTGRAPYSIFQGVAQPWYTPELSIFFMSWALIPALVASYIFLSIIPKFRSTNSLWNNVGIMGFIGLVSTALNYVLRTLPTFGGRYFYWLYLLMLPLSAMVIRKVSKGSLGLIFCVALISVVSFYGIQDPTLSANTYGNHIGWADKDSWHIALTLSPYLDPETSRWIDPRLSAPLSSLPPSPIWNEIVFQQVVIIGIDNIGLTATLKDPRDVGWFMRNIGMDPEDFMKSLNKFNKILDVGKYAGVWVE